MQKMWVSAFAPLSMLFVDADGFCVLGNSSVGCAARTISHYADVRCVGIVCSFQAACSTFQRFHPKIPHTKYLNPLMGLLWRLFIIWLQNGQPDGFLFCLFKENHLNNSLFLWATSWKPEQRCINYSNELVACCCFKCDTKTKSLSCLETMKVYIYILRATFLTCRSKHTASKCLCNKSTWFLVHPSHKHTPGPRRWIVGAVCRQCIYRHMDIRQHTGCSIYVCGNTPLTHNKI